jgi:hypothetical protein
MQPDEPTEEERLEELPEDGQTPFSPPDVSRDLGVTLGAGRQMPEKLDDTHPVTDSKSNIQPEEEYDEGISGATEPNAGNSVVGYRKPEEREDRAA